MFPQLNPSSRTRTALFMYVSGTRTLFLDGESQGAATSLVVPAGVSEMLLTGCGGGGGGGGGFATSGGGGGGGGAGASVRDVPVIVVPGSTLTISIGGGGSGGAVGAAGAAGASSNIDGLLHALVPIPTNSMLITPGSTYPQVQLYPGNGGSAGAAVNGGSGGGASYGNVPGGTGGAGAGAAGQLYGADTYYFQGTGGGAGGAGGGSFAGGITTTTGSGSLVPGAFSGAPAGTASNGGGGCGGASLFSGFGIAGRGGNASTPTAANPGVFGGGGGGGSGNNLGREGGDGFVLLRWQSPW